GVARGKDVVSRSRREARWPIKHLVGVHLAGLPRPFVTFRRARVGPPGAQKQTERTRGLKAQRLVELARRSVVLTREEHELVEPQPVAAVGDEHLHDRVRESLAPFG